MTGIERSAIKSIKELLKLFPFKELHKIRKEAEKYKKSLKHKKTA